MVKDDIIIKAADRTNLVQEYYFSAKLKEIDERKKAGADIINLGIGSPDMAPPDSSIKMLITIACRLNSHAYQSYVGIPALREAFAKWYKKYFKVELNPLDEILPLMGSKEGIMHISLAFLNPEDEVLVPDPGYPVYATAAKLLGCTVKYYNLTEMNHWIPDFNEIEQLDLSRVKIMWVNYPHMPTGTIATHDLFEKIIEFGKKHSILICNDNPYSFILNTKYQSILFEDDAKSIALELNSLSKSNNMAGWRIGMVAGHSKYITSILKVKSNMDSGMFLPLQLAAVEALNSTNDWYIKLNEIYKRRRIIVEEIMELLECKFDKTQVGLFVWGKIPKRYNNALQLTDDLLYNTSIFITPGIVYGSNGKHYIRISLCCDEVILLKAKERVRSYINKQIFLSKLKSN